MYVINAIIISCVICIFLCYLSMNSVHTNKTVELSFIYKLAEYANEVVCNLVMLYNYNTMYLYLYYCQGLSFAQCQQSSKVIIYLN